MENNSNEKPCLVQAGQGFSVLYKDRFLYSKYSPDRAIKQAIAEFEILPGSLILVFSPCLWYGLEELLNKCDDSSIIVAVEKDPELYEFSKAHLKIQDKRLIFLPESCTSGEGLQSFLNALISCDSAVCDFIRLPPRGNLRRVLKIDFSAGAAFNQESYHQFFSLTQNAISSLWKNHLTLVKFARLYSRNIFKNLGNCERTVSFSSIMKKISSPIIVFGAGESIEKTLSIGSLENYFIIAVDAAVMPLLERNIHIDAIVGVESQLAIEKAYIGTDLKNLPLFFCDLTSRASLARRISRKCFFLSQFDRNVFLQRLNERLNFQGKISIPVLPALGSVGLTATYIALLLRKTSEVPVYISGLDFSFSGGKTHARGTTQLKARLCAHNRKSSLANFDACYSQGTEKILNKNRTPVFTSKNLYSYAMLFRDYFSGIQNLFDAEHGGLDLGLPQAIPEIITTNTDKEDAFFTAESDNGRLNIKDFLLQEKNALEELKDLLTFGDKSQYRSKESSLNEQLLSLLEGREYLYLHFPDGFSPRTDIDFLKRIRSEIDFYLKDITLSLK